MRNLDAGNVATSDLSHRYLWADAIDQLLADEQVSNVAVDGETLWALTDRLSSVRDMIDNSGEQRLHRRFGAFGDITSETHYNASGTVVTAGQTGYVDVAFAFTGQFLDKATGLQNHLNRWYDPAAGRWISEDPIGFAGGDANLYRYVGNQSTLLVDPSGLHDEWPDVQGVPPQRNTDPELQLEEIEAAKERAQKPENRPNINDPDDPWDGAPKKPKQNAIGSIGKSRQNADWNRGGFLRLPRTSGPRIPSAGGAAGMVAVDFGVGIANDVSGGKVGNFLDNTVGSDPWDMWDNLGRLSGSDAGYHWSNLFNRKNSFKYGAPRTGQ